MAELKDLETRGKELAERVGQEIKKVRGEIAVDRPRPPIRCPTTARLSRKLSTT